jgi:hypothetical protein
MFETHVSSVSSVFKRMLQMFFLDISKVDRVLLLGLACCDITARAQTSGHRKRMGRKQSLQEVKRRGCKVQKARGGVNSLIKTSTQIT